MVMDIDRDSHLFWLIRYDHQISSLDELDMLYLITTRLRYENNIYKFMEFIIMFLDKPSGLDLIHRNIFNIYYTATQCGLLGDDEVLKSFERRLQDLANIKNQSRYWNILKPLNCRDLFSIFNEIFEIDKYKHLDPKRELIGRPHNPIRETDNDFDKDGNVIYY